MPSNLPIDGHSFRRVEVLTGAPRRRRWSAAEKAAIVAESLAPGAVASTVALRHGLHRNQLYMWRREVRSGALANSGALRAGFCADRGGKPCRFRHRGDRNRDWRRCAARRCGRRPGVSRQDCPPAEGDMISALSGSLPAGVRVLVATRPVDFRRGADGLAGRCNRSCSRTRSAARSSCSARSAADRVKLLVYDGTGLVLIWKRLEGGTFKWPPISDGVMRLSGAQLAALFDHAC